MDKQKRHLYLKIGATIHYGMVQHNNIYLHRPMVFLALAWHGHALRRAEKQASLHISFKKRFSSFFFFLLTLLLLRSLFSHVCRQRHCQFISSGFGQGDQNSRYR
ncbi:hypothetical protein BCR43DRAFT_497839 [Syncephalastrum racemosum]|uniref:Uncharacterized protein n=1 Tax=Syncephalastrum racemosum TaxID=13706 RepID=A0A1X2H304_SYNRA|nr:hypothetical protein BCR43DRAFT_497839 [Syncephalastrum racemosum]